MKLFFTIIFIGTSVFLQAQKFISVKGKDIIGVDGKPFLIKGTNLGNWLVPEGYMFKFNKANSPRLINDLFNQLIGTAETAAFWKKFLQIYITEPDIIYLKKLGMNSLRIPFHYKLFTDEEYMGGSGAARGFMLLDKVIGWCKKQNLYVILDMHCAPGGQTGDNIDDSDGYPFLFENEPSRQLTIDIWRNIARHYKNEPIIMGYDLLNEPIAHFFDTAALNHFLEPLYKQIVAAIRKEDKNHLVFIGGAQWNSNFRIFGKPIDPKAVYTFHKYWTATTQEVIQEYVDYRNKYNVPIYVGETGENSDEWVQNFRILCDQNNIGWHFWPYKKMSSTRGIVDFEIPPYFDQVMKFADTTRATFEQIRSTRPKNAREIKQAFDGFLINCEFSNCRPNKGYITALGLGKAGF